MQHLMVILLALVTLAFSYTQFEIQRRNLKLGLFKDRLAVRQAALLLLQMIVSDHIEGRSDKDWHNAADILSTGKFLFMKDNLIDKFISELQTNFHIYRSLRIGNDQNQAEVFEIKSWAYKNAQLELFDKYLNLEDDKSLWIYKVENWLKCKWDCLSK